MAKAPNKNTQTTGVLTGDKRLSVSFAVLVAVWLAVLDALSPYMGGSGENILSGGVTNGLAMLAAYAFIGLVLFLLLRKLHWSIVLLLLVGVGVTMSFFAFMPLYLNTGQEMSGEQLRHYGFFGIIWPLMLMAPYAISNLWRSLRGRSK